MPAFDRFGIDSSSCFQSKESLAGKFSSQAIGIETRTRNEKLTILAINYFPFD
ncbi:hypothetical protein EV05_0443 [Prochlorococcus sp. MIT 0601]|nr:hypothetical protein EV05_0443 [Prochlorococcus sp. MIT 0601]